MTELTILLPLPPKQLSPNWGTWGGNRFAKMRKIKEYRSTVATLALAASKCCRPYWTQATAQLTFYWPDRRRRDTDNAEQSFKAGVDGIVDAGIIVGDHCAVLTWEPTKFEYEKHRRDETRLVVIIRAAAAVAIAARGGSDAMY
jgi:Holliday junction resolvase RusA-like endonuclease